MTTQIPMLKSKGFNEVRKILIPNGRKGQPSTLNDEQKLALIEALINSTSTEIRNYRIDRKYKTRIASDRVNRGYRPKIKTSKEEYFKSIKQAI